MTMTIEENGVSEDDGLTAIERELKQRPEAERFADLNDDWPGSAAELRRQVRELTAELNTAKAAVGSLSVTCADYATERDAAVSRNGELARTLVQLQDNNSRLVVEVGELQAYRDEILAEREEARRVAATRLSASQDLEEEKASLVVERSTLLERINDLTAELGRTEERLRDAGAQLRIAERLRELKDNELEQFKEKVVAVACEQAEAHGWCSVIDDVLGQLGLERPAKSYTGTLQITVTFNAEMASRRDEPSSSWVRDSIRTAELQRVINQAFAMDADHDSVNVTDVDFEVTDVEMDD